MTEESLLHNPTFWVAIAFAVFVILAAKPVARLLTRSLDDRALKIKTELDEARRLREEAEAVLAAYQQKQRESLREAEAILSMAREEANRFNTEKKAELQQALDKRMKLGLEKIAQAEAKALEDVQSHVVDIAIGAARTIIQEHMTKGAADDLFKTALEGIERKLH